MRVGYTYFRWWGFSINEGEYPNIHVSWRENFYAYLALSDRFRWLWTVKMTFAHIPRTT